jgi:DNA helicase-2/ATP-dependent DNA helicase PcrA
MATVQFTKEEFSTNLGEGWEERFSDGQYVYQRNVGHHVLKVYSSVGHHDVARDTGEDSIRFASLVMHADGKFKALGKKQRWVTRIPGWEERVRKMVDEIEDELKQIPARVPLHCGKTVAVFKSGSAKNPGRMYMKCFECNKFVGWCDELEPEDVDQEEQNQDGDIEESVQQNGTLSSALGLGTVFKPRETEVGPFEWNGNGYGPNDQQLEIINHDPYRACVVTAPPGSGKTYTTENLIVRLIKEGVPPGSILYCTLSKDMATEGAERIKQALKNNNVHVSDMVLEEYKRWFCTIHAACNRMRIDWTGEKLTVIDTGRLSYKPKEFLDGKKGKYPRLGLVEKYWRDPEYRPPWEEVFGLIQYAKAHGYRQGSDLDFFCRVCNNMDDGVKVAKVRAEFDEMMRTNTDKRNRPEPLTTFSDMQFWVHDMLKNDHGFRARWAGQFQFVINDEGQDTTQIQMEILTMLAGSPDGNQVTVGDANQMLYRFAGASPETNVGEGFEEFFPESERKFLIMNYRSHSEITDAANRVIEYNYQSKGGEYSDDLFEPMESFRGPGGYIGYHQFETPQEESMFILEVMKEKGMEPGDVFVIARTKKQLAFVETFFLQAGIPYINRAGSGFWSSKHVSSAIAYLRLALNHDDDVAFEKCYNMPTKALGGPRYFGPVFLKHCRGSYRYLIENTDEVESKHWGYPKGTSDMIGFVRDIESTFNENGLTETLQYIIDECIYPWLVDQRGESGAGSLDDDAEFGDKGSSPLHELKIMKSIAGQFGNDTDAFFAMVDKATEAAEASKDKSLWGDYVILSTIHKIKGQERPYVFVIGCSEGYRVTESGERPVGLMPHTFSLTAPPPRFLLQEGMTKIEDERCDFYVAITRAKDACWVSSSVEHPVYDGCVMNPSRFVYEAGLISEVDANDILGIN